jgi:YidC/Oxa1 family membrane protein insertase
MIVGGVLTPIENVLRWILEHLHDSVGLSWGWSIIGLTVIVRVLLVPLMVKQIHSMQSMQRHMPEMKAIQQKYKGDRQRLNEELMKFYKENNINPAASCLPLVLQIPIFFALYFVLKDFEKHVQAPKSELGWLHLVPNITDKITSHWSGYLLLVVYVASQVSSGYFASTSAQRSQRILLMVLPVFFVPVITHFPIGLLMYWMTTNLWTVGQGIVTRRMVPKPTPPPKRTSRTPPKDGARPSAAEESAKPASAAAAPAAKVSQPPRRVKRKKKRTRR